MSYERPLNLQKEITLEDLQAEMNTLREHLLTHNHLDIGNAQLLSGVVKGDLKSGNFKVGSAGWRIQQNGLVEFQNATIRGTLNADDIVAGDIATARISANAANAVNAGTLRISANRINIDGTTVFASGYDPSTKAKTFRQISAPTTGMVIGDVWIDTNDGDRPYTYNGTAWVQALTIIDGGRITTGTIDASVVNVANLNATNIKAGILTGIQINTAASGQRIILFSTMAGFYNSVGTLQASLYAFGNDFLIKGQQTASNIFLDAGSSGSNSFSVGGVIKSIISSTYGLDSIVDIRVRGNIEVWGTVDGVDISAHDGGAIGTYHTGTISSAMHGIQTGIPNAHHSSTSSGIHITPNSVVSSGVVRPSLNDTYSLGSSTRRWFALHVRNITVFNQFVVNGSAFFQGDTITRKVYPDGNNTRDLGLSTRHWRNVYARALRLNPGTVNPAVIGEIVNCVSGGVDQFRGRPGNGTWIGRFDMTAV